MIWKDKQCTKEGSRTRSEGGRRIKGRKQKEESGKKKGKQRRVVKAKKMKATIGNPNRKFIF